MFPSGLTQYNQVASISGGTQEASGPKGEISCTLVVSRSEMSIVQEWLALIEENKRIDLKEAIEREDYELAATLRDELKRYERS